MTADNKNTSTNTARPAGSTGTVTPPPAAAAIAASAPAPAPAAPSTGTTAPAGSTGAVGDASPPLTEEQKAAAAAERAANRSKVYIVTGKVNEFGSAAAAEKFLNQPDAPKEFAVIKGHRVESKQRVSLRD